jgi:hypothetical protein
LLWGVSLIVRIGHGVHAEPFLDYLPYFSTGVPVLCRSWSVAIIVIHAIFGIGGAAHLSMVFMGSFLFL